MNFRNMFEFSNIDKYKKNYTKLLPEWSPKLHEAK